MDVNLAYYLKKDWRKFLEMIDDRDSKQDRWKEWHKSYLKVKRDLISQGFAINDFVVDLNELKKYCADMGMKIDENPRSRLVSNK